MKLLVISFLPVQNVQFYNFSLQSPFHGWISCVDGRCYEIYAYIYHRNLPTVGEYTIPYMDGMGFFLKPRGPLKPTAIAVDRESPFFAKSWGWGMYHAQSGWWLCGNSTKQRLWGWFPNMVFMGLQGVHTQSFRNKAGPLLRDNDGY